MKSIRFDPLFFVAPMLSGVIIMAYRLEKFVRAKAYDNRDRCGCGKRAGDTIARIDLWKHRL